MKLDAAYQFVILELACQAKRMRQIYSRIGLQIMHRDPIRPCGTHRPQARSQRLVESLLERQATFPHHPIETSSDVVVDGHGGSHVCHHIIMTQSIMMHNASAHRAPVSRGPERT